MINARQVGTFLREARNDMKTSQIFTLLGMLTVLIAVSLTFVIYLGLYGFRNPDKPAWIGMLPMTNDRVLFKTHS